MAKTKFYEVIIRNTLTNEITSRGGIRTSKKTAQEWANFNNENSVCGDDEYYDIDIADEDAITWHEYIAQCDKYGVENLTEWT